MIRLLRIFFALFCSSLLILILVQCAVPFQGSSLSSTWVRPKNFPSEIKRLENIVQKQSDSAERARAYLELASLYASYKNPSPDYQRALKSLEAYAELDPAGAKSDEVQNWLAVLRELNRVYKEYGEMKDTVEKLKHLDIKMEEKRKQVQ